jgi:hypothetical protein
VRLDPARVFLYVSGGRGASLLDTSEWAVLAADGSSVIGGWEDGATLAQARAEHALVPISHALAETVPEGVFAVAAAGGSSCVRGGAGGACGLTSIETSIIDAVSDLGAPAAWAGGGTMLNSRVGLTGIVVNDFLYGFNGWGGQGGSFPNNSEKSGSTTCTGGPPCLPTFSAFSAGTVVFDTNVRYRSGMAFFGAYFYFVGGSSSQTVGAAAARTVVRGGY